MGNENSKNKNETSPEKHENGSVNGLSANITSNGLEIDVNSETTVKQNGGPISLNLAKETTEPDSEIVESDCKPTDAPVISDIPVTTVQEVVEEVMKSKEVKVHLFGKMFKKKAERSADVKSVQEKTTSNEDQTDVSLPATDPQPEPAILEQEPEPLREPERVTIDPGPEGKKAPETDERNSQPLENQEDSNPEKNLVMNFFKTLVTPTKTTKKETATPDATKDQSQKETQPAATTTVAQVSEPPVAPKGMSIPPPPPPEPPKMEIKGEPAAKPVKPISKEETKAAAKEPESSKGKSAKDTLSKFFRPKVLLGVKASKGKGASASGANAPAKTAAVTIKEAPQPALEVKVQPVVEVQRENIVEPHETAEEVAQPVVKEQMVEKAPPPVVEAEKVDPSKASTLEAAAKPEPPPPVQEEKKTASKSPFLSFFKPKPADPKKATPAPAAEAAPTVKAKEEPKPAAKSSEAVVDSKPASVATQAADEAANVPRKLEKRNSIHLFFKNLSQKRNSTDAGVQTEPVTVAPAEKTK
ncbi:breast carcinoma-amplified sequence 1 isoform X2 [Micropterus salmoides]|uniref:breast carcinoma-amplified sequence 1 isoform X2 n=1 Tax=Micropterus salmoides TaxID=27706 RepID=UPI0018EBF569|nr:breast carcinoma-amplified sequence 1 isoform X2 [Micropterus salmoides]